MNKLEKIQSKFYTTKEGELDLAHYGQYKMGLTTNEIKDYLIVRSGKLNIEKLYKKFVDISGVNTVAIYTCPDCKKKTVLIYRHDVQRFSNVLFGITKETYFD